MREFLLQVVPMLLHREDTLDILTANTPWREREYVDSFFAHLIHNDKIKISVRSTFFLLNG